MEGARYPRCENNNVEGMGGSPPGFRVRIYVRGELSPADRIGEISCARCRFLTGRKLNPRERQFRRGSAASICARRRRLLDKRSNFLCKEIYYGGGMYSPSPSSEGSVYIRYIYIYIYLFPPPSEYISRASHALASLVIPCILRDILEWREANGNRQMIHEDVKRDVEKRS